MLKANRYWLQKIKGRAYKIGGAASQPGDAFSGHLRGLRAIEVGIGGREQTFTRCIQGSAIGRTPGLVEFVPAVAYYFCVALPAAFLQPGARLLTKSCIRI